MPFQHDIGTTITPLRRFKCKNEITDKKIQLQASPYRMNDGNEKSDFLFVRRRQVVRHQRLGGNDECCALH